MSPNQASASAVVAYVPDRMDRSKVAAARPDARFVAHVEDLAGVDADLVVIDLGRPGAVDVLARLRATRTIGFASHIDRPTLDAARAAGCHAVARSVFFGRLTELVAPPP